MCCVLPSCVENYLKAAIFLVPADIHLLLLKLIDVDTAAAQFSIESHLRQILVK